MLDKTSTFLSFNELVESLLFHSNAEDFKVVSLKKIEAAIVALLQLPCTREGEILSFEKFPTKSPWFQFSDAFKHPSWRQIRLLLEH